MTGKERVTKAFRGEKVDRVPWVPFVGCHGGSLIGVSAQEYLKSEQLIAKGVARSVELYKPDGVPVNFDLQVEAEVFGCELAWADENPPSVVTHPLAEGRSLEKLEVPGPDAGRIATSLAAARAIRAAHPDIAVYGLITGPFTLALHLLGTDIFMKMFDEPDYVERLMDFCRRVAEAMAGYYIEAGCDVIAVVDPMTSQIGPDQFRQFVTPHITPVFQHIRKSGALGSFFVCGHAQQNVEAMCECGPDNVSVDENIPLDFVRDVCRPRGVSFGGNMQLTTVLLLGTAIDSQRNAVACMEAAGEEGFILAPGCDLPYATPPENLAAVSQVVQDADQREAIRTMARQEDTSDLLDMAQYGQSDKVIIDVITLDSESCAPCQYMVEAVRKAAPEFDGIVEWREHKIKYRESLVFMTSLMVRNVPTICIDGQIRFVSRIPKREELIAAIQQRINEKLRSRIKQRRSTLYVLGADNEQTAEVLANTERAAQELGVDVAVERISEPKQIESFGLLASQTPAVVLARYQVKSTRKVPEVAAIREWLRETI
jgi:uroporphyrinogen decarboxylase